MRKLGQHPYRLLFGAMLLVHILPIWLYKHFPSDDGPAHLYNAYVLKDLVLNASSPFQWLYRINTEFHPNWLLHVLIGGLLHFFSFSIVEKIIVTLAVVSLPLALRFLFKQLKSDYAFWSLLSFPLIYNYSLSHGSWGYSLGLCLVFVFLGRWISFENKLTLFRYCELLVYSLLLCAAQPTCLIFAILGHLSFLMGMLHFWREENRWTKLINWLLSLSVHVPAAVVLLLFMKGKRSFFVPAERLNNLSGIGILGGYNSQENYFVLLTTGMLFALGFYFLIRTQKIRHLVRPQFILMLAAGGFYFFGPNKVATANVLWRTQIFFYFFWLIWLSSFSLSERAKRFLSALIVTNALLFLRAMTGSFEKVNLEIEEILAAGKSIPEHAFLYTFPSWSMGSDATTGYKVPFRNYWGYLAIDRGLVVAGNYEPKRRHFPLVLHDENDPEALYGFEGKRSICLDFSSRPNSARTIEYLYFWGVEAENLLAEDCGSRTMDAVINKYELIFRSSALRSSALYRLRK